MSFYLMHRGWMDNPAFGRRGPFCKRLAWVWLIEEAAWSDRKVDIAGRTIALRRGQLAHSYRFMAEAWKWSLAGVQRFIERLKTDTMIETASDTGRLIITICNYERYQAPPLFADTPSDTDPDTEAVRGRYASGTNEKEGKEGNNIKKERASLSPVGDAPSNPDLVSGQRVVHVDPNGCQAAVSLWNEMAAANGFSAVRTLTDLRRQRLRLRLKEAGGIDGWKAALALVAESSFLRGEVNSFKADFDFVIQQRSFTKLLEGAYSNRGKPRAEGKLDWIGDLDRTPTTSPLAPTIDGVAL